MASRVDNREAHPYRIYGTDTTVPKKVRVSRVEEGRRAANREKRTPRCIMCGDPRDRRSFPICSKCEKS